MRGLRKIDRSWRDSMTPTLSQNAHDNGPEPRGRSAVMGGYPPATKATTT